MAETVQAKALTIGVCHSAYQIEPEIRKRLPEVTVFQTFSTEEMKSRMPNVLITLHTGGETSLYETRLVDIMVENTRR